MSSPNILSKEETPGVQSKSLFGVSFQSTVESEPFCIDFQEGDRRNPANFSLARKWVMTITACAFGGIVAAATSSYEMGYSSMIRDLDCTFFQATIGLSVFTLGVGMTPLVTSSLSEEFGRFPFYVVSSLTFMLTEVMIALASNVQTVIGARLLGGISASTGSILVGGTLADIWPPHQRGFPMSFYALIIISSLGLGPVVAGWIEANPSLGWRWIQWVHVMCGTVDFLLILMFTIVI